MTPQLQLCGSGRTEHVQTQREKHALLKLTFFDRRCCHRSETDNVNTIRPVTKIKAWEQCTESEMKLYSFKSLTYLDNKILRYKMHLVFYFCVVIGLVTGWDFNNLIIFNYI